MVPAPVLAQVSRSSEQVQLRRLLRGCDVVSTTEADAHAAARLMGLARTDDVVDGVVAHVAVVLGADVATADGANIRRLLDVAGGHRKHPGRLTPQT
jgi:predicted nucleic acid-binding protein